jgi:hypothetical protein
MLPAKIRASKATIAKIPPELPFHGGGELSELPGANDVWGALLTPALSRRERGKGLPPSHAVSR